jgi:hypothetical protein
MKFGEISVVSRGEVYKSPVGNYYTNRGKY